MRPILGILWDIGFTIHISWESQTLISQVSHRALDLVLFNEMLVTWLVVEWNLEIKISKNKELIPEVWSTMAAEFSSFQTQESQERIPFPGPAIISAVRLHRPVIQMRLILTASCILSLLLSFSAWIYRLPSNFMSTARSFKRGGGIKQEMECWRRW